MSGFTFPETAKTLTLSGQGSSSTVTALNTLTTIKDYDYAIIQADGADARFLLGGAPSSTVGCKIPDGTWCPNLLGSEVIQACQVYGVFNIMAWKRPGKQ